MVCWEELGLQPVLLLPCGLRSSVAGLTLTCVLVVLLVLITLPITRTGRIAIIRRRACTVSIHGWTFAIIIVKKRRNCLTTFVHIVNTPVNVPRARTTAIGHQPASHPPTKPANQPSSQPASRYTLPADAGFSQSRHVCTSER